MPESDHRSSGRRPARSISGTAAMVIRTLTVPIATEQPIELAAPMPARAMMLGA